MATLVDHMVVQVRVNPGTPGEVTHSVAVGVDYRGIVPIGPGPAKNWAPKVSLPGLKKGDLVEVIWGFDDAAPAITATPNALAPVVELRRVG